MTWHMVYVTATGKADSIGTVVADPLPDHLTAVALSDHDADLLLTGAGLWNPATLSVEPRPVEPDPEV